MYSKDQLIERGEHFFNDPNVEVMYATEDGQFFHENAKNYATGHAKSQKCHCFKITRADCNPPLKSLPLENLQQICEKEGYPKEEWGELKAAKLRTYIKNAREIAEEEAVINANKIAVVNEIRGLETDLGKNPADLDELDDEERDDYLNELKKEATPKEEESEEEESEEEESEEEESEEEESEEEESEEEALYEQYKKETSKNALYRGNETKAYQAWKKALD